MATDEAASISTKRRRRPAFRAFHFAPSKVSFPTMNEERQQDQPLQIAAVDLGSNSFHMIIARMHGRELTLIDRLREQVRLADGLDEERLLDEQAQTRALECLRRFGQRLAGLSRENIRAVGTNTLRRARNAADFLDRAEEMLGHPIEIISGIEEARLIYSGVAHSLAADNANRLVMDIGGGSTELIIGRGFEPMMMESLSMGCVTMSARFFAGGAITRGGIDRAMVEALLELEPKARAYRARGWQQAVGSSGTLLAVNRILVANGWSTGGITPAGVRRLIDAMLGAGHAEQLRLDGLSQDRARILPGGVVILLAALDALGITHMEVSDGALREGVLYDLIGRHHTDDVRDASVKALARRYHVDEDQAERVAGTALRCLGMVAADWHLDEEECAPWLRWAAHLHEIGLDIAHSHHQRHGAYVLEHADLAGFSFQEQQLLSLLVLAHRRKPPAKIFKDVRSYWGKKAERLALLLRLAALLHRSRGATALPDFELRGSKKKLELRMPPGWIESNPLTCADLERETRYLAQIGVTLDTSCSCDGSAA